jgi:aryl-alcohol dehydrogenase-like predicted oxidoreductase
VRLALGTAQFGMPYGISNKSGQTSQLEAKNILDMASASGVDTLDTAVAYGDSETTLGRVGVAGWNVISKIPPMPVCSVSGSDWVLRHLKASLSNLKIDQLNGVLLHAPEQLLSSDGAEVIEGLEKAKLLGLVKKVGYSIYSPECLPSLLEVFKPDIVQLPLNIFDQRAINTGWLAKMIELGIEIHARSIFMQGLLLMSPAQRPPYFHKWNELFQKWDSMVAGKNALEVCFSFIKSIHGISRVVVGVESQAQLSQLLFAWNKSAPITAPQFSCEDEALVNPSNWRPTS